MTEKKENTLLNLLESFKNLHTVYKERDNKYKYHQDAYGNTEFIGIDLEYESIIDALQGLVLKEIDQLYTQQDTFFFDCSFDVYKANFLKRKNNYLTSNPDANELHFLNSEIRYFKNPGDNRFFGDEEYYYNSFFQFKESYILTYKRKLKYLDKCFNVFDYELILPDFFGETNFYENIKVKKLHRNINNIVPSVTPKSTYDYPLNNDYKRFALIINLFKTETDINNPIDYFKSEYKKRNDIFSQKRFYSLCLEYLKKTHKAFIALKNNDFKLKGNESPVSLQIMKSKNFIEVDQRNLFKKEKTIKKSKVKESDFLNAISSLENYIYALKNVSTGLSKTVTIIFEYFEAFCNAISDQNLIMNNGFFTAYDCDITHYTSYFRDEINQNLLTVHTSKREDYLDLLIDKIRATPFFNFENTHIKEYITKYNIDISSFPKSLNTELYEILNTYPNRFGLDPIRQVEITQTQLTFYAYFSQIEANKMVEFLISKKVKSQATISPEKVNKTKSSNPENFANKDFKTFISNKKKQEYIYNLLEHFGAINSERKSVLTDRKKGVLRGVVEALMDCKILPQTGLHNLCLMIAKDINLVLKSKLDYHNTAKKIHFDAKDYIKDNPFL